MVLRDYNAGGPGGVACRVAHEDGQGSRLHSSLKERLGPPRRRKCERSLTLPQLAVLLTQQSLIYIPLIHIKRVAWVNL